MNKQTNQPKIRDDNFHREQYRVLMKSNQYKKIDMKGKKILDFGAGNGEFSQKLNSNGADVDCFEINENSIKILKKKGLNIISKIKSHTYDYVFFIEVIEHLVNPKEQLDMLKDCLKERGKIFITTPNHLYWKLRIKYLLGNIEAFEYPNKHFSLFTKKSLTHLLSEYFIQVNHILDESKLLYVGENKMNAPCDLSEQENEDE